MVRRTAYVCLLAILGLSGCDDDPGERQPAPDSSVKQEVAARAHVTSQQPPETIDEPGALHSNAAATPVPPMTEPSPPATQEALWPAFQPLADARVGERAVYRALDSQVLSYEIRKVGLSRVETEVSATLDGRPLGMPAVREDLRTADPLAWETPAGGQRRTTRTRIRAAGRDWDAVLYEDQWTDEGIAYVRKTWVSAQAPVFGIVLMELTGDKMLEVRLELIETAD